MTIKKDYELSGVNCANCAVKIEAVIREIPGIKGADLNFSLSKLSIVITDESVLKNIEKQIQKIMTKIEKGSKLLMPDENVHKENGISKFDILIYAIGIILYFTGFFLVKSTVVKLVFFILTYLIFGNKVLIKSFNNILKGQIFDENFLMSIASIGAFIIGEYPEAAAVMMFYQVGEMFQDYALDNSRRAIKSLVAIKPDFANIKTDEGFERVDPAKVKVGDYIIIRPGERVPLDGVVIEGNSALDTSALTGESLPREIGPGYEILSGSINQSGVLVVRVNSAFENSTVNRILTMVEHASQKKSPYRALYNKICSLVYAFSCRVCSYARLSSSNIF